MNLEPFVYNTGEARKMLEVFKKMYVDPEQSKKEKGKKIKWRHWILYSKEKVVIEKKVTTKHVNEFILNNPNKADKDLVEAFAIDNKIDFFEVPNIEIREEEPVYANQVKNK